MTEDTDMEYLAAAQRLLKKRDAENARLRAELFKIQCQQLRVATATDMTRLAMREAAMDTRNEIIKVLAGEQSQEPKS